MECRIFPLLTETGYGSHNTSSSTALTVVAKTTSSTSTDSQHLRQSGKQKTIVDFVPKNWSGFFHFSTDRTALNSFCVIYSDCSANEWPGRPICLPIWTACPPSSNIDSLSPHPRCHPVTTATANKREQLDIATGSVSLSLFIRFYRKTVKSAIA